MSIAVDLGMECFTTESHASQAYLEITNAIMFTDEDMDSIQTIANPFI